MILKNIKAVFLSNIVIQIIGFISSFVIKRLIEPSLMGIWNLVTIITNYIQMFNLGTPTAAQREMPYYLGREDFEMEEKIRETYFFVLFIEFLIASTVFFIYFFMGSNFLSKNFWYLYLLAPFYAFTTRTYNAMIVCFLARQKFVELSKQNICISLGGVIFPVLGSLLGGIIGLFIGFAILYTYRIYLNIILAKKIGLKFKLKFHFNVFKQLFKLGFPMEMAGYLWGIFMTIDSVLATKWLGIRELAFYALGVNFSRQLSDFPTQVNTIFYPRIMHKYGKDNDVKSVTKDVLAFFTGNLLVVIPFLCLAGCFFMPWLIRMLIRNYSPAIPPARILLFSMFFIPQIYILMNIFNLKKQVVKLILFNGIGLAITFASIYLFNLKNANLESIALGTITGYMFFFITLFLSATVGVLNNYEKCKILLFQSGSIILTAGMFLILEKIFPAQDSSRIKDTVYTGIKIFLSFLICLPTAIFGLRVSGVWQKVKEEMASTWSGLKIKIKSFIPDVMSTNNE